jgi:hypothetical protein
MKTEYQSIAYSATTSEFDFDNTYDYCLYRQDWSGREIICFNADEIEEVLEMIELGEIVIHFNYSILYCKDEKAYNALSKDGFSCFATIF